MAVGRRVGSVFIKVRADGSKLGDDMEGVGDKSGRRFGKGFNRGVKAMKIGAAAAVVAAGAFAKVSVQAAGEFETKMNEVFTLLPGISKDAMGGMSDQVLAFSKKMGVLPETVIPALYQALSAGVPQNNVFAFMETAQKAALGGITDVETAVDGISSAVNAYGSEVLSAQEASDAMFTAVRLGKTTFPELSQSLFNVTPVASALGVGFDQVTAGLAAITAQGTPTRVAATQMRQLFVELSKAGSKSADTFERVAGKSFQEFIAGGGNVAEALDLMQQAADDSDVKLQDLFGSVEAGQAALQLAGNVKFTEALDEMAASAGATDAAYTQMDQGIARSTERMSAKWAVLKVKAGQALAPTIEKMMDLSMVWAPKIADAIGDMVAKVRVWLNENKETFDKIFARIKEIVTGTIDTLVAAWAIFGDQIVGYITSMVDIVRDRIKAFVQIFDGVIDLIKAVWTGDWSAAWDAIKQIFTGVWDLMIGFVRQWWVTLKLVVATILDGVKLLWDWSFLSDWVAKAFDAVKWYFVDLPKFIVKKIVAVVAAAVRLGKGIVVGITAPISRLGSQLWGAVKAAWDWLVSQVSKLNPINLGSKILSSIPGGGAVRRIGKVFGFADGGVVTRPTFGLVGEGSVPEIVTPQALMAATFRSVLESSGGGGGGGVQFAAGAIVVNMSGSSETEAARAGETIAGIVAARLAERRTAVSSRASLGVS